MLISSEVLPSIDVSSRPWEIVERKGIGHPDTLADSIAERVSADYSNYCLENFGVILHHNADKTAILGGKSRVRFGGGEILAPISVQVNGRFSPRFGDAEIPYVEIVQSAVHDHICSTLSNVDPRKDIDLTIRNSLASSPGFVQTAGNRSPRQFWFEPRDRTDLPDATRAHANDTSCGVGFAPLSALEQYVVDVETTLNENTFKSAHPAIGTDIKVMAMRQHKSVELTVAVPVIDRHTQDLAEYRDHLAFVESFIRSRVALTGDLSLSAARLNARDDFRKPELYMTVTGSSIESGDEGMVGRGNRSNGLITPLRLMTIEAACGKNPVYHVGKLYNIIATEMAALLHRQTGAHISVSLVSRTGAWLDEPDFVGVSSNSGAPLREAMIKCALADTFASLNEFRMQLVEGKRRLC